jgi:hypothetical protein
VSAEKARQAAGSGGRRDEGRGTRDEITGREEEGGRKKEGEQPRPLSSVPPGNSRSLCPNCA